MFPGRAKVIFLCLLLITLCACGKTTTNDDLFPDHYVATQVSSSGNFTHVEDICTFADGIYLLAFDAEKAEYTLCGYDQETLQIVIIGEFPDNTQSVCFGENTIIAYDGDAIVEYDSSLNKVSVTETEISPRCIIELNGTIYAGTENAIYSMADESLYYRSDTSIDSMHSAFDGIVLTWWQNNQYWAGVLNDNKELTSTTEIGSMTLLFCGSEIYHPQGSLIYTYDLKSSKDTPQFTLTDCNIEGDYVKAIYCIGEKQYLVAFKQPKINQLQFALVEATDDSTVMLKKITIGTISDSAENVDSLIKKDIEHFNMQNTDTKAELVIYRDETALQLSLVSGDGPDILDLNAVDRDTYAAAGLLEDLLPWISADKDLDEVDFVQSWLDTMKTGDKMYGLYPAMLVRTLVARRDDVPREYGWSLEEFSEAVRNLPEDTSVIGGRSAQDILGIILSYNMDDYVDFASYTCDFCTEDFYALLEMSKLADDSAGLSDEALLTYWAFPYALNDALGLDMFQALEELYPESEYAKVGFPGAGGNGAVFYTGPNYYGMTTTSQSQAAVWEFLKFLLSSDNQKESRFGFPVMQAEFDRLLEQVQKPYITENDEGEAVTREGLVSDQVVALRELIGGITELGGVTNGTSEIIQIIFEETESFFQGDKQAETVSDIIQNRVSIYLAEQQ